MPFQRAIGEILPQSWGLSIGIWGPSETVEIAKALEPGEREGFPRNDRLRLSIADLPAVLSQQTKGRCFPEKQKGW